jgi:hypothetical protein
MNLYSADQPNLMDRILDTAADNLRIAKILVQMGLDPDNVTYDAIFNRVLEIVLANINLANMFALYCFQAQSSRLPPLRLLRRPL